MSEDRSTNGQGGKSWLDRITQAFSDEPRDRDDLLVLLKSAEDSQVLDSEALGIIEGAMAVSDMQVRDIMIPRPQMVVIDSTLTPQQFLPEMIDASHSRFPVIGESPDEVIGILLAKDLLPFLLRESIDSINIQDLLRPATFVPESKRLNTLLGEFRATRSHMAVVVDEYGGIAGLITIEDVLEQIVGEIEDEYDAEEEDTPIKQIEDNAYIVKALTEIEDFNDYFNAHLDDDEFDTVGGIVTHCFGHLPQRDEQVDFEGFRFKVLNADNRRIRLLQVSRLQVPS
ncbi:CBS domain-containing protein [Motiliproteus coralliicola]|uniref:Magnesium and cobalt efflux protein CorC n=1 Tax=Motiliproteus coralliicola TaxID=2283196 RepID=A0A369WSF9_9GAMM|nr:transporter associated domain-containing protein [Motiliproteus coralliicola]RDE24113.1 CBS domain-containing protein [Motiliproteus coralliicola]